MDNPLKGLVPYQADVRELFPHSMEFNYLPYAAIVKGYDTYDWTPLDAMLNDIASRGHQAVFRIFLEYPSKSGVIPEFLIADGLKVTRWKFTESESKGPRVLETPDYEDPRLRRSLRNFIAALGRRYDGDPRIGFITAGLLGTWGEWHNWPRDELFASKAVQIEVMDAYTAAFRRTPVLLRHPAGDNDRMMAGNAHRPFGYHDDSFAWGTLDTKEDWDEWHFMNLLEAAGAEALSKWKTHPIGGEIRPEAWGVVFDANHGVERVQDFDACVDATHVSWLLDSGMFDEQQPADRVARAAAAVRRMGYEFHVLGLKHGWKGANLYYLALHVENRGVAPFYHDWPAEWGLLREGKVAKTWPADARLSGLLPGEQPRVWEARLDLTGVDVGEYKLAVRVPNPLKGGHPVRFANETQDADAPGWLTLVPLTVR